MQVIASIARRLKYGGSRLTISITMIPSDQMSTWKKEEEEQVEEEEEEEEEEEGNGVGCTQSMYLDVPQSHKVVWK